MMTPYDTGETKDASEINDASPDRSVTEKPSRQEAEAAIDVLLRWIGENPAVKGLPEHRAVSYAHGQNFAAAMPKIRRKCWRAPLKKSKAMTIW